MTKGFWKRGLCTLLVAVSVFGGFAGCAPKEDEVVIDPELVREPVFEDNKTLHIGAWIAPPPGFVNDKTYREVADSGINCIYALYEGADGNAVQALQLAEKYGIKYLVRDWSLGGIHEEDFDLIPSMVEPWTQYPAYAGHLIADEPGANQFDRLGKMKEVFDTAANGGHFYINLYPTYSSLAQRDGRSYLEYVSEYVSKVKPDVISYDHYPLMKNVEGTAVTEDYLLNLEIISRAAREAGVPWWNFMQTMSFGRVNREPDYDDLRWQAYTTLAFGASGIQHFCYWSPKDDGTSFGESMIDREGNKTPLYDAAKFVNYELLAFDHIYLSYKSVGQMVFSPDVAPLHTYLEYPLESFAPVKSVEGGPVLMGCFEDENGNQAIMLVNMTDPGHDEAITVRVTFNDTKALNIYTAGRKSRVGLEKGAIEITLESGEGKFIQILK